MIPPSLRLQGQCRAHQYQKSNKASHQTLKQAGGCVSCNTSNGVDNSPQEQSPSQRSNRVNQGLRALCRAGLEHQRGGRALTRRQCHSTTASDWMAGVIDLGPCSLQLVWHWLKRFLPELFWGRTRVTLNLSAILIEPAKRIGSTAGWSAATGREVWMAFCEEFVRAALFQGLWFACLVS